MRARRNLRLCVVAIAPLLLAAGVAAWWSQEEPVDNLGVVESGVLCRGGQPDGAGWRYLRDHHGIRTVIDLREDKPNTWWAIVEKEFCARNGIRHIKLPIGPERLTDEQLRTVVETVADSRCRPVFIHCQLGESRTGVVVAAYRIVAQGWSLKAAVTESLRYREHMNPGYAAYLEELADGHGWRPQATTRTGTESPARYP